MLDGTSMLLDETDSKQNFLPGDFVAERRKNGWHRVCLQTKRPVN